MLHFLVKGLLLIGGSKVLIHPSLMISTIVYVIYVQSTVKISIFAQLLDKDLKSNKIGWMKI